MPKREKRKEREERKRERKGKKEKKERKRERKKKKGSQKIHSFVVGSSEDGILMQRSGDLSYVTVYLAVRERRKE